MLLLSVTESLHKEQNDHKHKNQLWGEKCFFRNEKQVTSESETEKNISSATKKTSGCVKSLKPESYTCPTNAQSTIYINSFVSFPAFFPPFSIILICDRNVVNQSNVRAKQNKHKFLTIPASDIDFHILKTMIAAPVHSSVV